MISSAGSYFTRLYNLQHITFTICIFFTFLKIISFSNTQCSVFFTLPALMLQSHANRILKLVSSVPCILIINNSINICRFISHHSAGVWILKMLYGVRCFSKKKNGLRNLARPWHSATFVYNYNLINLRCLPAL